MDMRNRLTDSERKCPHSSLGLLMLFISSNHTQQEISMSWLFNLLQYIFYSIVVVQKSRPENCIVIGGVHRVFSG
jgi:hypothetical protein